MDKISRWIWKKDLKGMDQYCDFADSFEYISGKVTVRISADSNYALYLNGALVESGQYGDYPHYKVYDEIDITAHCIKGINNVAITVWYYGKTTLCYYPGNPALRYEILIDGEIKAFSDKDTLCRKSKEYQSGLCKQLSSQLGFSFHYDATGDDGWKNGGGADFEKAEVVPQDLAMHIRPVKKLTVCPKRETKLIKSENGTHFLYDIGEEEVGYFTVKLHSKTKQKILFAYGEHIKEGCVRRIIGPRDFSVEVTVGEGETEYINPYRRLGLRYIEVFSENPIEPEYVTVSPTLYPLEKFIPQFDDPLDKRIYEVCVRTLELCMHEHYEDCPWREQSLYCMDSRNQMLCGYYCFGEKEYPRANLRLMSEDRRDDGLLSICFPSKDYGTKNGLAIPSFSLHWYTQMREYLTFTEDTSLAREVYPKMVSVIKTFTDRIENGGCIRSFEGNEHWNYYEWSDGLAGTLGTPQNNLYEAALNLLLIIALRNMAAISIAIGEADEFTSFIPSLKESVRKAFFDNEKGFFVNSNTDSKVSELVNSLALLSDVCTDEEAERIAAALTDDKSGLTPVTLSMLCFKYDALLKVDYEKYKPYILENIRQKYKLMLDAGATTFWEKEDIFATPAGSHCHGWSALPVYYYEIFNGSKEISALL